MEITIEEFQRLSDDKTSKAVRIAELERELAEKNNQMKMLKDETKMLNEKVAYLENIIDTTRMENMMLKNYITLSVEKIKSFVRKLKGIERFAFLKAFLEYVLPQEHYQEQLLLVNEVLTVPDETKSATVVNNNFETGSGCQVFNSDVNGDFNKK